jgi:ribosomal protein L29
MNKQERNSLKMKPLPELEKLSAESRDRLRHLKLDLAAGKVKNVGELRTLRKDIARIKTALTEARHAGRPAA